MPACCCIPVGRHAASPYRRIAVSMHCRPAPQQDRSACVYQTVALRCLPGLGGALSAPCARLCNRLYCSTSRSQLLLWVDSLPPNTLRPPGSRTRGTSGSTCALPVPYGTPFSAILCRSTQVLRKSCPTGHRPTDPVGGRGTERNPRLRKHQLEPMGRNGCRQPRRGRDRGAAL